MLHIFLEIVFLLEKKFFSIFCLSLISFFQGEGGSQSTNYTYWVMYVNLFQTCESHELSIGAKVLTTILKNQQLYVEMLSYK